MSKRQPSNVVSRPPKPHRPAVISPDGYEQKHVEILKAAAALFAERGYHRTSIRDLSRATGRSLAGLYYYFDSKEELLYQIQHHCYGTLLASVRDVLAPAASPHDRVVAFISHHLGYFARHMDEMKVLAHEDMTLGGNHGRKILEMKRAYAQILVDTVAEYPSASSSGAETPSPEVSAFILFGMMNWLYTWPKRLRRLPPEEIAETVAQIFLCGFPGCSSSTLLTMRGRISCPEGRFWKREVPQ